MGNIVVPSYSHDDSNSDDDNRRHVRDQSPAIPRTRRQTRGGRLRSQRSTDQAESAVVANRNRPTAAANEDSDDDSDQEPWSVVVEEPSSSAATKRRGRHQSRGGRRPANHAEPTVVASRNRPTTAANEGVGRRARTATLQVRDRSRSRSRSPISRSRTHHHQCRTGSASRRRTGPVIVIAAEERDTVAEPQPCLRRSKRIKAGQRKNKK